MDVSTVSWIHVTDKMMKKIGFGKNQSLYKHIKKNFIKTQDYTLKIIRYRHSIQFCKYRLDMTQTAYDELLRLTHKLRTSKKPTGPGFVYILHNPVFQYYGPNVYKVGYSCDTMRRKGDGSTMLLEDSVILYQREVPCMRYERIAHKKLAQYRMKKTRELFDCPLDTIKKMIDELV